MWILVLIAILIFILIKVAKSDKAIGVVAVLGGIIYFAGDLMNPDCENKTLDIVFLIILFVFGSIFALAWYWSSDYAEKKLKEKVEKEKKTKKTEEFDTEKTKEQQIAELVQSLSEHTEKHPSELQIALNQLDALVGLDGVKEQIHTLTNFITIQQQRKRHHLKALPISYHCVFAGPPGTGKTTVARILAKVYKELGILKKGQLIETDRAGLVGEYVGQTAVKTNKIVDSAIGGVLFIDEAYNLYNSSSEDYGREAIATLIKRMEDQRNNLVVIMAGYSQEMEQFVNINPGLKSRFNRFFEFKDYTPQELLDILKLLIAKNDYFLTETAAQKALVSIEKAYSQRDKSFGNARFIRNLFEKTIEQQALRIASLITPSQNQMMEITDKDIPTVVSAQSEESGCKKVN